MDFKKIYERLNKIKPYDAESNEIKQKLLKEIETEILTNGKTNKGIISAFKRSQKNIEGTKFAGINQNNNGNYILTNTFYLLDFGQDINNIPKELLHTCTNPKNDFNWSYEKFKNSGKLKTHEINCKQLEKIRKYNNLHKDDPCLYRIDDVYINANYLLDMLVLSGHGNETLISCKYDGKFKPINIEFDNCKMILLPINTERSGVKEHQKELEKKLNEVC